jgi:hypothetical protein
MERACFTECHNSVNAASYCYVASAGFDERC